MHRRTFLHYLAIGAALALGAGVSRQSAHATEAKGDFFMLDFPNLQGQGTALKNYVGQPLVVNFWATWCPPCVKEMPDLDRLSQQYPDVRFLGLAIDTQRNVKKFIQEIPVSYDLLVAGHAGVEVMRGLGNTKGGLPFTVLFDAQGQQQDSVLGQIDPDALSMEIDQLV